MSDKTEAEMAELAELAERRESYLASCEDEGLMPLSLHMWKIHGSPIDIWNSSAC